VEGKEELEKVVLGEPLGRQSAPPFCGGGLVHVLILLCVPLPLPNGQLQFDCKVQFDQPPSNM